LGEPGSLVQPVAVAPLAPFNTPVLSSKEKFVTETVTALAEFTSDKVAKATNAVKSLVVVFIFFPFVLNKKL
jgi:hypothetical protein